MTWSDYWSQVTGHAVRPATDDEVFTTVMRENLLKKDLALVAPAPGLMASARKGAGYAAARVLEDENEQLAVQTSASEVSFLVITRSYDRGWTARVDGQAKPVLRTNLAFMGVFVPAGEHRVVLTYRPVSFLIGAGITVLCLLTFAGLYLQGPGAAS